MNSRSYNFNDFSNTSRNVNARRAPKKSASVKRGSAARKRPAARKTSSTRRPSVKKVNKKSIFTLLMILLIVGAIILIGTVSYNLYRQYRRGRAFIYSDGVRISGIDIGGLTEKEASDKLKADSLSVIKDFEVKVKVKDEEKIFNKDSFKYNFNFDKALKSAKKYSMKEQGLFKSKDNKSTLDTIASTGSPEFKLDYKVVNSSLAKHIKAIAKKVDINPKNARVKKFHPFAENRFEYQEGSDGYKLDIKTLSKKIKKFIYNNERNLELEAKINKITPSITVNDLKTKIIGLATASTVSQNTDNGTHNMKVAMNACNGSVIEPGATWSFNKCTGDSNLESNGYKEADVISEKKVRQGIGGGICQASTIIFEAGLFSNMEIVERHNHYWASKYAYAGEDATIDYPDLDLKMRNKTKYQMFMECRVEDGVRLRVNIWGYQDPAYDNIRIHSENFDITSKDFNTRTFRELFKDGKIIKTEEICDSHYSIKYSVKTPDAETYRTRVDGYVQYEDEDYIPMDTGEDESESDVSDEESENSGDTDENSGDDASSGEENEDYSDEESE